MVMISKSYRKKVIISVFKDEGKDDSTKNYKKRFKFKM